MFYAFYRSLEAQEFYRIWPSLRARTRGSVRESTQRSTASVAPAESLTLWRSEHGTRALPQRGSTLKARRRLEAGSDGSRGSHDGSGDLERACA